MGMTIEQIIDATQLSKEEIEKLLEEKYIKGSRVYYTYNWHINENNEGAIEFYKKFNFEVDRKVPHYYNNGDGAIVMYLQVKV